MSKLVNYVIKKSLMLLFNMWLGVGGLCWGMWGWVSGLGCVFWDWAGLFCGFGELVMGLTEMDFGCDFGVWGGTGQACGLTGWVFGLGGLC